MFRMNRRISVMVSVVTFILNWLIFWKGAAYFEYQEPAFIASIIMGALLIHELGHWVMFEVNGVKTHIFFAVIIGGAMPAADSLKQLENIRWSQRAAIALAGVAGNLLMVVGAGVLYFLDLLSAGHLEQIANLNGILVAMNLLPMGILDGGRFVKMLFDSISEDRDWRYAYAIAAVLASVLLVLHLASDQSFVGTNVMIYLGLMMSAKYDDPAGSMNRGAMTARQQWWFAIVYVLLFSAGLLLSGLTASWKS